MLSIFFLDEKNQCVLLLLLAITLIVCMTSPIAPPSGPSVAITETENKLLPKEENIPSLTSARKKIASILEENRTDIKSGKIIYVAETIYNQSLEYGYDPLFILAIIKTESSFLNMAVSSKGARGLMQIIPATGEEIARKNDMKWEGHETLHIPWSNIRMGTYYFSELLRKFDGNTEIALEAYNNGPNRIRRLIRNGGRPSFRYAKKVLGNYQTLLDTYGAV